LPGIFLGLVVDLQQLVQAELLLPIAAKAHFSIKHVQDQLHRQCQPQSRRAKDVAEVVDANLSRAFFISLLGPILGNPMVPVVMLELAILTAYAAAR